MSDEVVAFVLDTLREMDFDVEAADADSQFGPAGIDLDSLAAVELAVRVQDAYGVAFTDEHMEFLAVATVGELAAVIVERSQTPVPSDSAGA
jgi:acyl carrier protein